MQLLIALLFSVFAFAQTSPVVTSVRTVYSVTNVTTATPVTLVASASQSANRITVFDSSGNTMKLIITSGLQVDTLLIPPGGGDFSVKIPKGAKIEIQAVSANATTGENDLNVLF